VSVGELGNAHEIDTFETLETLKHLYKFERAQDIRVLCRNLDDNLKILADIDT
jgi:hypothetical protein